MIRIEVKDFQSIAHEVVEVDGFSVLVGRSNIGKSALVRAIKAALTGAPADAFVRHGPDCPRVTKGAKSCKCFCSVHLVADGFDLLWEKGDAVNRYVYNGAEHTVVGKGTPEFLLAGFAPAKIGDDRELLQVADQFQPIFILNRSGTVVADVLSDVVKLDQINTAIRLVEKDRKEATATRKVRERDVIDLKLALERYLGLDDVVARMDVLEADNERIAVTERRLIQVEGYIESILSLARMIKSLAPLLELSVPNMVEVDTVAHKVSDLYRFQVEVADRVEIIRSLEGVDSVEVPACTIASDWRRVSNLQSLVVRLDSMRTFFERHRPLDAPIPVLESVTDAHTQVRRLEQLGSKLDGLNRVVGELEVVVTDLSRQEEQILAEFATLGVCPTCSQPIEASHQHHVSEAHA